MIFFAKYILGEMAMIGDGAVFVNILSVATVESRRREQNLP